MTRRHRPSLHQSATLLLRGIAGELAAAADWQRLGDSRRAGEARARAAQLERELRRRLARSAA